MAEEHRDALEKAVEKSVLVSMCIGKEELHYEEDEGGLRRLYHKDGKEYPKGAKLHPRNIEIICYVDEDCYKGTDPTILKEKLSSVISHRIVCPGKNRCSLEMQEEDYGETSEKCIQIIRKYIPKKRFGLGNYGNIEKGNDANSIMTTVNGNLT